jgi:ankyrin repeat protein
MKNGDTPLHWAGRQGHTEIVSALIAAGVNLNPRRDKVSKLGVVEYSRVARMMPLATVVRS